MCTWTGTWHGGQTQIATKRSNIPSEVAVGKHSWGRTSLQKHVAIFSSLPKGIVGGGAGRAGSGVPFPVLSPEQLVGTAEADNCVELRGWLSRWSVSQADDARRRLGTVSLLPQRLHILRSVQTSPQKFSVSLDSPYCIHLLPVVLMDIWEQSASVFMT